MKFNFTLKNSTKNENKMKLKIKGPTSFKISKIEASENDSSEGASLVRRLNELGLQPGLEVTVVTQVSFGSVTVIRYGSTTLALNAEEFACLHGP